MRSLLRRFARTILVGLPGTDMPGWDASTVGVTNYDELPENARRYLVRIEELVGIPLDIISTGPDRAQTIIKRNPFD